MSNTYALAKQLRAVRIHSNTVVLVAEGEIAACHEAYFQASPILIYPPHYELLSRYTGTPGEMCMDVMRPYRVVQPIPFPADQSMVHVRDAAGDHAVKITPVELSPLLDVAQKSAGVDADPFSVAALTSEVRAKFTPRSSVGYSERYDLGEAIQDALRRMPPAAGTGTTADQLYYFQVSEIGVEIGGIAGLNHLRVLVQTFDPA